MQSIIYIISLLLIFSWQQSEEPLVIKKFEPSKACIGDTVYILGTGFSTHSDMPNVVIFNGGVNVPYYSSSTLLKVVVPSGVVTGKITVRWGYQGVNSPSELIILKQKK